MVLEYTVHMLPPLRPFLARDSIHYNATACYMLLPIRPSVCPPVCHTGGSVKNGWS